MILAELQREFCAWLVDQPSALDNYVDAQAAKGLAVYHHAYRAQLVEALQDSFDKSWAWLGDEAFETAARAYIAEHPPHSWTMGDYGEAFPDFLSTLYPDDPEVPELAHLEWGLRRAFDGMDADATGMEGLADIDWDNATLYFVPTLRLIPVTTNCGAIWSALDGEEAPPDVEILSAPAAIRVWRQELAPQFVTITDIEHKAILAALNGANFGQLCAVLVAEVGDADGPVMAATLLGNWLRDGLISDVC